MKETSLIQLLKSLTPEELRKLDKFLRSPYFTEGRNLSSRITYRYFETLRKYHPHFKDEELSPEKLYLKLYHAGNGNVKIMRKLNSDLLGLIEKFLSLEQYEIDGSERRHNLLLQLSGRRIEKVFKRRFDETLKYLETIDKDDVYYNTLYKIWTVNKNYLLHRRYYKLVEVAEKDENFFKFAILVALGIYLQRLSLSGYSPHMRKLPFYEEILSHIQSNYNMYKEIPSILIYYNLIKMFESRREEYYFELKKLKSCYLNTLSFIYKYNLYVMMRNFCKDVMISSGRFSYREEIFKLDSEFLKTNFIAFIAMVGEINTSHFIEIAKNAIKLNKFSWAEKFVREFNSKIDPRDKDDAVNYLKALAYFQQKNYNNALELIAKVKGDNSQQKQHIRDLILQIHYEMGADDMVLSFIDTSRHFIRRDKHLNEEQKKDLSTFLGFTEKLIKLKYKPSMDNAVMLKKEISNHPSIEKEWLLEKADDIINSSKSR